MSSGGWIRKKRRLAILLRNDHTCVYCGAEANTIDHLRPRSRGGSNADTNLVAACRSCNSSKKDLLLSEWCPDIEAQARKAARGRLARHIRDAERRLSSAYQNHDRLVFALSQLVHWCEGHTPTSDMDPLERANNVLADLAF